MKEEEEDRVLLSRLGVTSANPEDIEHHILAEVHMHGLNMCLGSISVSMLLHETSFCFVRSHLTSGLKEGEEILNKTRFSRVHSLGDEESLETILRHSFHLWGRHHRNGPLKRQTFLLHLQTLQIRKQKVRLQPKLLKLLPDNGYTNGQQPNKKLSN